MSNWNVDLIHEIRLDLFGLYYQLGRMKRWYPEDLERIEMHISGFMETYIVLKRAQNRWDPTWDKRCDIINQNYNIIFF